MFQVATSYPADAIDGADFFSGAAQRRVMDGDRARPEMILVSDRAIGVEDVLEGRIAVSEQTVRTMGNLVGLVDPVAADKIKRENTRLVGENDRLSAEVLALRDALAAFEAASSEVFIAADGHRFGSAEAAIRHMNPQPTVLVPAGPLPTEG